MGIVTHALNLACESEPQGAGLVGYILNRPGAYRSPPLQGGMFDYILAAGGLYLHADREEMEVCFQIAQAEIRGLGECDGRFDFRLPDVPSNLVEEALETSLRYAEDSKETLFWLEWSDLNPYDEGWLIREPEQTRTGASCRPVEGQDEAYSRAIIEIHSHHSMPARFSGTDDRDETGFRLYGVIGRLPEEPEIRLRVGCYGYQWEVPASWALELPVGLRDCNSDWPLVDNTEGEKCQKPGGDPLT